MMVCGLLAVLASPGHVSSADNGTGRLLGRVMPADTMLTGFTAPYRHAVLATLQPGRLSKIAVREGQQVQEGELLASLDSRVQAAVAEIARLEAQSTVKLDLTRVQMEHARVELDRMTRLSAAVAAADSEIRQARLDFETASLAYRQAEQEHAQAGENHRLQQEKLAQYELRAPFSGVITAKLKEAGETVEELEGVLELSQIDSLIVSVDCPLALRPSVRIGDRIPVTPAGQPGAECVGKVTSCMPIADPSSQTFKLKLVIPNADQSWIAGALVHIDLGRKLDARTGGSPSSRPGPEPAGS